MDLVYCYPPTLKKNKNLLKLMEKNHFQPVFQNDAEFEANRADLKMAVLNLEESNHLRSVEQIRATLPHAISSVFIVTHPDTIMECCSETVHNCDIIMQPFEDEDIIHGLKRCRSLLQADDDLETFKNELDSKQKMLKVYKGLTKTLASTLNMKQLLNKVKDKNSRLLQCASLSLYLFNDQTSQLDYIKTRKKDPHEPKRTQYAVGQGIPGQVFKSGKKLFANAPFKESIRLSLKEQYSFEIQSICCIPLKFKERYLGIVEAINKNDGPPFDESDLVILQILADHAAIAIENSILFERVRKLTIIDDLTQAYNFRFFDIILGNEFRRAKRFLSPLSLIFLDLDGFKRVNDRYGHMTGSMVLREIASMIKKTVRKSDIVARFGGDEFTVILPNTGMDGARRVARRIQQRIESFRYPIPSWKIDLSASIGISSFPEHVKTKDELLKVADKAMYKIKENQRKDVSIGVLSHKDIQKLAHASTKREKKHEDR